MRPCTFAFLFSRQTLSSCFEPKCDGYAYGSCGSVTVFGQFITRWAAFERLRPFTVSQGGGRAIGFESTCRLSLYREAGVFHQHRVAVAGAEVLVEDDVAGDDHGVADSGLGRACDEQVVVAFGSTA